MKTITHPKLNIFVFILYILTINYCKKTKYNLDDLSKVKDLLQHAEPDYFPMDIKIVKLGTTYDKLAIYYTELIWGNLRATYRLIILSNEGQYLGNFYLEDKPKRFVSDKVQFNFDSEIGNTIDFSKGIPSKIYLNGHTFEFDSPG